MASFNKCIFLKWTSLCNKAVHVLKFAVEFFETL